MTRPPADGARLLLVVDTATTRALVALGRSDGTLVAEDAWVAGYRHGEELLPRVEAVLAGTGVSRDALGGLVVGTGPGAFTGLRVGIATMKALAHALGIPIVGVGTGAGLLDAARAAGTGRPVLLQPAGPSDRVLTRHGEAPRIVPGGEEPVLAAGETLVAVDLVDRAHAEAVALGERARAGLALALLAAGAARLAAGDGDDLARLAPEYVTLPRGVRAAGSDEDVELSGSRDAGETGVPR